MENWSQPGAGRDLSDTVPDPRPTEEPVAQDDQAEWDELSPSDSGRVTPPHDVLVAGAPLAQPANEPVEEPAAAAVAAPDPPTATASPGPPEAGHGGGSTVLASDAADRFQERWRDVQFSFVDDPRIAAQRADELAAEVLSAFTDALGTRKRSLDGRRHDGEPDTERLRLAVRAYREFVDKLLNT